MAGSDDANRVREGSEGLEYMDPGPSDTDTLLRALRLEHQARERALLAEGNRAQLHHLPPETPIAIGGLIFAGREEEDKNSLRATAEEKEQEQSNNGRVGVGDIAQHGQENTTGSNKTTREPAVSDNQ